MIDFTPILIRKWKIDNAINNIKADLDDAKESFSDCENENDKAFQQGRIFAHNYDLLVIDQILSEKEKRKSDA